MKIVAVIAARGGSKSIKNKNIKKIGKKSLVNYIISTLLKIKDIDRVILSSDSKKILNIAKKNNNKRLEVRKRDKILAKDKTPLTAVSHQVALDLVKENYIPDIVLQVAPTCPFIKINTIIKIIKILKSKKTDCVATLKKIEHEHPYRAKKLANDKTFNQLIKNINVEKYISRQDLPTLYCTSGAIYGRTYKLLKTFSGKDFCFGKKPMGVIVNDIEAINIDRKIDLDFARFIAKKYKL